MRILFPLMTGICAQWYGALPLHFLIFLLCLSLLMVVGYGFLRAKWKYTGRSLYGAGINGCFLLLGALMVWMQDVRNRTQNMASLKANDFLCATLQAPLVEKQNSYKGLASVERIRGNEKEYLEGTLLIYFKKEAGMENLSYGSRIVMKKSLQRIHQAGNPGAFDYERYCLFNGITHQVYLTPSEFVVLPDKKTHPLPAFIFHCRQRVVSLLKQYIPGEKESGLAEALLIGYKDDLDKDLVQAYSNTGVVHIIAISGLHLGLIYGLLLFATKRLRKKAGLPRLLIILSSLWLFSLLAGGGPSVLRSTVMFSFLALSEVLKRRSNMYNSLALSAIVLLCLDPFWLWDAGFQLSYSAVISILLFFRPVYNWIYFSNKFLDAVWKLNAVTIAAQVFTLPICLYQFHQFPLLFLFTNVVAVPLSSLVLMAEILLCAIGFFHGAALLTGVAISKMIWWMNNYIEGLSRLPIAVWNGLYISGTQAVLLYGMLIGLCSWLMRGNRSGLWAFALCAELFLALRSAAFLEAGEQKKMIVYHVPRHTAIDLVYGRSASFLADSTLAADPNLIRFQLAPSRVIQRFTPLDWNATGTMDFEFCGRKILLLDADLRLKNGLGKLAVDVLILLGHASPDLSATLRCFSIGQVVIDGSVPAWKAARWEKIADSLHIPCFNVAEKGAFVMNR